MAFRPRLDWLPLIHAATDKAEFKLARSGIRAICWKSVTFFLPAAPVRCVELKIFGRFNWMPQYDDKRKWRQFETFTPEFGALVSSQMKVCSVRIISEGDVVVAMVGVAFTASMICIAFISSVPSI